MAVPPIIQTCDRCGTKNRVPVAARGKPRCGRCHRDLAWIVEATDDTFAEIAEPARPLVLVDLWAPWCGPCRVLAPILEDLATDLAGHLKIVKVNVDQAPQLAARFDTRSSPTLVLMRHGQELDRQIGLSNAQALRDWIDAHLDEHEEAA